MKTKLAVLSIVCISAIALFYSISSKKDDQATKSAAEQAKPINAAPTLKATVAESQTVKQQQAPAAKKKTASAQAVHPDLQKLRAEQERITTEGYGTFPPVDLENMNPHKAHVLEALKNPQENGGTISIIGKRKPFDLQRYKENPSYYLDTVEPGRAFDAASPKEGVEPLRRVGKNYFEVIQNQMAPLSAQGEPDMPISFTAFDGGHFQNGLSFITLRADAKGVATAEFTPTTGVINQCRIRAASPVNSNTLQWMVMVHLPPKKDTSEAKEGFSQK